MSKLFYDHIIIIDDVHEKMSALQLPSDEYKELVYIIDSIIHHRVVTRILDLLPREVHEIFLQKLHDNPSDSNHVHFINRHIESDIVVELTLIADSLRKELLEEISRYITTDQPNED